MMIYAIFLCLAQMNGNCQQVPIGYHLVPGGQSPYFASKAECEKELANVIGSGAQAVGYRCLGRHVETWQ